MPRHPLPTLSATVLALALLGGCTASRELAGAISGRPYVPTAEERAKAPANPDFRIIPPADGKAVVYVYRTSQLLGALRDYEIFLDDRSVGRLSSGSYRRIEIDPGEYKVRVQFATMAWQEAPSEGQLRLEAGSTLVLRMNVSARQVATQKSYAGTTLKHETGLWMGNSRLEWVSDADGLADISRLGRMDD